MTKKMQFSILILPWLLVSCMQQEAKTTDPTASSTSKSQHSIQPKSQQNKTMKSSTILSYKGTIKYFQMEGGFYGIITDKGEKFLPMNLDKKYLTPGTVIQFSGNQVKGMMTIQQWGIPFKIKSVKLIRQGKETNNSKY